MNYEDIYIEIEAFQHIKTGEDVCGDDFKTIRLENESRNITVLSDGLGSGIKANLLASMTTSMALKFVSSNMEILKSAEIIMDTLPVCEVRKISYATFTIVDMLANGQAQIIEMDNPSFIHLRNNRDLQWEKITLESKNWPDRKLHLSEFKVIPGDRIIFCSDGVTQAGLGNAPYKFGWRRQGLLDFVQECVANNPTISARDLSRAVVLKASSINPGFKYMDDTSCCVIYLREPRRLRLLTGPPFKPTHDREYAQMLLNFNGKKVVCGGTTANIISRELNRQITTNLTMRNKGLPPTSKMEGIDLVTEGILTLTEVARSLENDLPPDTAPAVRAMTDLFMGSDIIEFIVGTKVNEAHQDPNLPVDLEIRRNIIKRLKTLLEEKYRKKVIVKYI